MTELLRLAPPNETSMAADSRLDFSRDISLAVSMRNFSYAAIDSASSFLASSSCFRSLLLLNAKSALRLAASCDKFDADRVLFLLLGLELELAIAAKRLST